MPPTFLYSWNTDRKWLERYLEYAGEVGELYRAPDVSNLPIDNPIVLSHTFDEEALREIRVYREWAEPQGVCDFIQTAALRTPDRMGLFSAYRSSSVGRFTEREVDIMRLLAPHIRRAVTISDLMDLKRLEAHAVAVTLDNLSAGVVVVAPIAALSTLMMPHDACLIMVARFGQSKVTSRRTSLKQVRNLPML